MAEENLEQHLADESPEGTTEPSPSVDHVSDSADVSLSRNNSLSRLNARAPEFVPRTPPPGHASARMDPRMLQIHPVPPPHPVMRIFQHPPPPAFHHIPHVQNQFEYFGGAGGGYRDPDLASSRSPSDLDHPSSSVSPATDVLSDDVMHKITNQVEYYFSDINLATTEHLMRFINKDPEGFVPMTVIAGFKKIKALVANISQLAGALRTSSKLVVSDDGKKVRRQLPFTDADLEELQSRIVVAENLPEDHSYQNLIRVFSSAGRVKTIRTCYPQTSSNGGASATSKPGKMDMFLGNKLHAFVEYGTSEEAEKAVAELNEENWRSGLRLRLLPRCMTRYGQNRGRKGSGEVEGVGEDEDASTSNQQPHDRHFEDPSLSCETSHHENLGDDGYHHEREGGGRRGRGRGRGGRGRSRGQPIPCGAAQAPGHPPSSAAADHQAAAKQPLGPRMPDGTRGFAMGRGKTPTHS